MSTPQQKINCLEVERRHLREALDALFDACSDVRPFQAFKTNDERDAWMAAMLNAMVVLGDIPEASE